MFSEENYAKIVLQALHLQADGRGSAAKLFRRLRQTSKVVGHRKCTEGV
jgi:hypothetical protein